MKLHRAAKRPDWVRTKHQNFWQRIARATDGVATPGNALSVIGLAGVIWGTLLLSAAPGWGVGLIAAGRLLDIADGVAADKTGTKSALGEAVDATFDKLAIAVVVIGLAIDRLVWWPVLALVVVQHLANALLGLHAQRRRRRLHPSALGKQATVWQWVGLCCLLAGHFWSWLLWPGYAVMTLGLLLGFGAVYRYARPSH